LKRLSENFRVWRAHEWLDQAALRGRSAVLPTYLDLNGACESKTDSPIDRRFQRGRLDCARAVAMLSPEEASDAAAGNIDGRRPRRDYRIAYRTSRSSPDWPAPLGRLLAPSRRSLGRALSKWRVIAGNPDALRVTGGGKET
jgi:hypothetical protein